MVLTRRASRLQRRIPSENMNAQSYCPLFTIIPPEIRNRIYEFSLESAGTDPNKRPAYMKHAMYYRPGFQRPKRINTSVLQTCRRIYIEACLVPIAMSEHTFWYHRAPPHVKNANSPREYFLKMTCDQLAAVQHLHFFMQQYCLEGDWWHICRSISNIGIAPKKVTITLRHSDWWHWESNNDLGIDPFREGKTDAKVMRMTMQKQLHANKDQHENAWGYQFQHIPGLEEIEIEFETVMRKKAQLDAIVEWASKEWKFPHSSSNGHEHAFVCDQKTKKAQKWVGAKESLLDKYGSSASAYPFDQSDDENLDPLVDDDFAPTPNIAVTVLETETVPTGPAHTNTTGTTTSEKPSSDNPKQAFDPETEEEYYVVFLTWTRQEVE